MICPHCGRKTDEGEYCQYCKKPTEFAKKMNYISGRLPKEIRRDRSDIVPGDTGKRQLSPLLQMFSVVACLFMLVGTAVITNHSIREMKELKQEAEEKNIVVVDAIEGFQAELLKINEYMKEQEKEYLQQQAEMSGPYSPEEELHEMSGVTETASYIRLEINIQHNVGSMNLQTQSICEGEPLPAPPHFSGYHFVAWNTEQDGSGQSYAVGESIEILPSEGITLYGQWESTSLQVDSEELPLSEVKRSEEGG